MRGHFLKKLPGLELTVLLQIDPLNRIVRIAVTGKSKGAFKRISGKGSAVFK
jgi:hypothetical protein